MQESVDVKDSESPSLLVCKKNRRYSYDVRSRSHSEVLRKEDSVHQSGETDSEEPNITSQVQKKIPMNQRRSYSGDLSYERIHRDSNGSRKQSLSGYDTEESTATSNGSTSSDKSPTYQNAVLFVSHLPATNLFPNQLFNLFSCFGEVLRVKIMSNDHTKALILFSEASQAAKALVLNGIVFRNEPMQVRFSNTTYVDPVNCNTCPSIRDLTEDFYGKKVHRFNSSEYAHIPWHVPSRKLHVVGFDPSIPTIKESLRQLFSTCGAVENVTILKNMAWIDMDKTESAVNAVAILHNSTAYTLPGKLLRVDRKSVV